MIAYTLGEEAMFMVLSGIYLVPLLLLPFRKVLAARAGERNSVQVAEGEAAVDVGLHERPLDPLKSAQMGDDGIRFEDEFIPWSDVLFIENEAEGVAIIRDKSPKKVVPFDDPVGFVAAAEAALTKFRHAPESPSIEALRKRPETEPARAQRLSGLTLATGYRGGGENTVDADALTTVACDPRLDRDLRLEAAQILSRIEPSSLARVRVSLDAAAEPEFVEKLSRVVGVEAEEDEAG